LYSLKLGGDVSRTLRCSALVLVNLLAMFPFTFHDIRRAVVPVRFRDISLVSGSLDFMVARPDTIIVYR
jgi:hypothetical protein